MPSAEYFKIHRFMIDELKLKGNDLLVYALIFSFTNNSDKMCFFGSQRYIGEYLGMCRQSVNVSIKALTEKGYIKKSIIQNNGKSICSYVSNILLTDVVKPDTDLSENPTPACRETRHNNYIDNYNKYNTSSSFESEKIDDEFDFSSYSERELTEIYPFNNKAGFTIAQMDVLYHIIYLKPLEKYLEKINDYDCKDKFKTIVRWAKLDGNYKGQAKL